MIGSVTAHATVEVIIVAYNSGAYLQACVDALKSQTFSGFTAVVVNNASTDGSVEALRLPDGRFSVLQVGHNSGFAAANNLAIGRSSADFVVLLNPDTVATPGWLSALVELASTDANLAAVGSVQRRLSEPDVLDGLGDVWHLAGMAWRSREGKRAPGEVADGEIFGPCAAGALYRRELFLSLGGFDERFFCYCEDVDLALRLRLAGYKSVRAGKAVLLHAGSGITGRQSDFSLYYGHRNRVWTFLKNCPDSIFWLALVYHIVFNLLYMVLAVRRGFWRPVLRAFVDAWKGRQPFLDERKKMVIRITLSEYLRLVAWAPWSPFNRQPRPVDRSI